MIKSKWFWSVIMPVTIRDVAKLAGLSNINVLCVLDGYNEVADDTHHLVEQSAKEMGLGTIGFFCAS